MAICSDDGLIDRTTMEAPINEQYDVIIIGAGHNGLVCGAYLAKAGLKVCALERREVMGGAAVTEEVWPGYHVSVASFVMSLMQPKVILDLELLKFGLEILDTPPLFHPFPDGRYIVFWDDIAKTCEEIAKISRSDASAYAEYKRHLARLAPILRRLLWEIPPDPVSGRLRDVRDTLRFLWRFRDIGGRFYEIYDLLTMSAYDYLKRWFATDEILAAIGAYTAASANNISIKSPGSAYVLVRGMLRENDTPAGSWGFARGGMGAISRAIAKSGARFGLQVRTCAEVSRVLVDGGHARGVALASGAEMRARVIVSNADAKTTFLKLVNPRDLPAGFVNQVRNFRTTSTAFKINIAAEQAPHFRTFPEGSAGLNSPCLVRIAPSVDYLERAYDDAKYGGFSRRPYMDIVVPTMQDATLAPPGKHIISILGGHAAYQLAGRSWDEARNDLFATVVDTISEHAPGFGNSIISKQILTPIDLESIFALPGGHVHHGDLGVDQIFFKRPAPHYANYRSPIPGLYQCGASTHPGGGVTGVPGHNAARVILRDLRR